MGSQPSTQLAPGALFVEELRRLRTEFEAQARQYHTLTLSIHYLTKGERISDLVLPRPHHAIALWQYMGDGVETWEAMRRPQITLFGLADAELTALGVIAGPETELFRRMASRAASLISDEARKRLAVGMVNQLRFALDQAEPSHPLRKPIFSSNPNPLAVWVNVMLTVITIFQPERFRGHKLEVDPFTGSLAAIDYLLAVLDKSRVQTSPSVEILELKPGIWGISLNLRELWRRVRNWWKGRAG